MKDTRAAWHCVYPNRPNVRTHLEAAAAGGHPVYFGVFEPWDESPLLERMTGSDMRPSTWFLLVVLLLVLSGALL